MCECSLAMRLRQSSRHKHSLSVEDAMQSLQLLTPISTDSNSVSGRRTRTKRCSPDQMTVDGSAITGSTPCRRISTPQRSPAKENIECSAAAARQRIARRASRRGKRCAPAVSELVSPCASSCDVSSVASSDNRSDVQSSGDSTAIFSSSAAMMEVDSSPVSDTSELVDYYTNANYQAPPPRPLETIAELEEECQSVSSEKTPPSPRLALSTAQLRSCSFQVSSHVLEKRRNRCKLVSRQRRRPCKRKQRMIQAKLNRLLRERDEVLGCATAVSPFSPRRSEVASHSPAARPTSVNSSLHNDSAASEERNDSATPRSTGNQKEYSAESDSPASGTPLVRRAKSLALISTSHHPLKCPKLDDSPHTSAETSLVLCPSSGVCSPSVGIASPAVDKSAGSQSVDDELSMPALYLTVTDSEGEEPDRLSVSLHEDSERLDSATTSCFSPVLTSGGAFCLSDTPCGSALTKNPSAPSTPAQRRCSHSISNSPVLEDTYFSESCCDPFEQAMIISP